ncbi:MAG: prolyl oligopeptidase family serine peptidase [Gemmatimonadaceae bacterium]
MYRHSLRSCLLLALLTGTLSAQTQSAPLSYPPATRGTQTDDYHGVSVADPYRWLEDTNSPATRTWIEAQDRLSESYLAAIPERVAIKHRLTQLWNYARTSAPFKEGGRYFYFQNSGLQNQSILYVQDRRNARPRILLDPNVLSTDGTVALLQASASSDGRYLGYSVSTSGSDWQEIRVRDVSTGRDLPDVVKWVKFSGLSWTRDNKGFFYSRYDEPTAGNTLTNVNKNHKLYYHRLGQPQARDELIFDKPDQPEWLVFGSVSDDGQFLALTIAEGSVNQNRLYFVDLDNPRKPKITNPVVRLLDKLDAEYEFVGNRETMLYVKTNLNAPKGRIIAIDIENPRPERWNTIVAEDKDALVGATIAGNDIVGTYLQAARSSIRFFTARDDGRNERTRAPAPRRTSGSIYDTSTVPITRGQLVGGGFRLRAELELPGIGTVNQINGKQADDEMFYSFTSFLYPPTVFRYDLRTRSSAPFRTPTVAFDVSPYETRQVFFTSKDGTRVPMFITARKGVTLNGRNPTILYAYGGFNIPQTPSFAVPNLAWLEMGGVYALANIRGGGEYGKDWHEAGTLGRKQNVFDDFIAAAEYLIAQKYTSTPKLAIRGGSNGGLLVGAVVNQRPNLFGAALPETGVMDMLRFHKFTIGWAWVSDYGSADKAADFQFLRAYSPLHNIKPGICYPPTLALTADHDDRVIPGHTFKYIAALQAAQACPNPILVRIEAKAGHGAGKPTNKQIDQAADRLAFLVRTLQMKPTLQ